MKSPKIPFVAVMLVACFSIAGCTANVKAKVVCDEKGKCRIEGSVEGTVGGGSDNLLADSIPGLQALNAQDVVLDLSGSTVAVPASGNLTITLSDSANGSVQAAKQFAWIRSGNLITLASPSAVNQWANANQGTANTVSYGFPTLQTTSGYGDQVFTVTMKYQGQSKASSSTTFTHCSPPGANSPYPCAI